MAELSFTAEQSITILAVILGLAGAIYAANRQFRASAISDNRQEWINRLRSLVAEVLATHQSTSTNFKFSTDQTRDPELRMTLATETRELMNRRLRLINEIELMINPNEQKHRDIVSMIKELRLNDDSEVRRSKVENIVNLDQSIFKEEWIRVKRGK